MPPCPFPARSDNSYRWRSNWADAQEATFAGGEQVRQLVEEQGPGFQERQIHNDPRWIGNVVAPTPAPGASERATTPDTSTGPRHRRWGDSDVKEEADLQRALDLSAADQTDPPLVGPFDTQVAPPAAAGDSPGGAAVELGPWKNYKGGNDQPIPVPDYFPRPQTRRANSREGDPRGGTGRKRSVSFGDSRGRNREPRQRQQPPLSILRSPPAAPAPSGNLPGLADSSPEQRKRTQDF